MIDPQYHNRFTPDRRREGYRLGTVLGRNVERLRTEQNLNKKMFSLMTGIGRPLLNDIEHGVADIRFSYVEKLADALDVDPIELLTPHDWGD